ncbi:MAG TPA: extracellular solute-binding protein [Candidatus Pullichristensenella excrementigallinarum]|uniref:Extracellular solute-binding protein n=1 Tax=Candidatus Pullichristensenella excrementigallinarum TaxID=2840907 RepID=A0A9D1IA95_9FIRM|nr:extracellular solute-binding protein [Candidatus Pullichristensenella excrementigallinarum]
MRRCISILCLLIMVALCFLMARISQELPGDPTALVAEKYAGWSGVLRLWIYEGWSCGAGSLSGWLNQCIASFEKAHPGVYVQPKYVDAQAIRQLAESGIYPPDMVLFPTGLLEGWKSLQALGEISGLRPELSNAGQGYAAPVAMGAYAWVYNRDLLDKLPADWSEIDVPIGSPEDGDFASYSGALLALCSDLSSPEAQEMELALPGLDLGLPTGEPTAAPTALPSPADGLPCRLPEGFSASQSAYTDFVNGDLAAIPVTQRELQRLSTLSESGKGPHWAVSIPGEWTFVDQILYLGIVARDPEAPDGRQEICEQFLAFLLTEDCQKNLASSGAFPTISLEGIYAQHSAYASLEAALAQKKLIVPAAFGNAWREDARILLERFAQGAVSAREGLTLLRAKCASS